MYEMKNVTSAAKATSFKGRAIHSSIIVCGREYHYRNSGLTFNEPPISDEPCENKPVGWTYKSPEEVDSMISTWARTLYTENNYHLLEHNSNIFANEFCVFLVGDEVDEACMELPKRVAASSFGAHLVKLSNAMFGCAPKAAAITKTKKSSKSSKNR